MDVSSKPTTGSHSTQHPAAHRDYLRIPEPFHHLHFPTFKRPATKIINVNEAHDGQLTRGDKIADTVAATVGSWRFIIIQSVALLIWLAINSIAWIFRFDPYPFILLNLALSFQAAYSAPFVMMSQNRQAAKDRLTAENDYLTDTKGEEEIRHILAHLEHQDELIIKIIERLESQHEEIQQQMLAVLAAAKATPAQAEAWQGEQEQNAGENK